MQLSTTSHPVAPPVAHCALDVAEIEGAPRIAATGDLDLFTAQPFEAAVDWLRPLDHGMVIDLAATTFIDSMGLRSLLHAVVACEDDGGSPPVLVGTSPAAAKLLRQVGLEDLFDGQSSADHSRSG